MTRRLAPALFAPAITAVAALAQPVQWINPLGGDWLDPVNWSPQVVPGPGNEARFELPGSYEVSVPAAQGSPAVGGLSVLNPSATIRLMPGRTLQIGAGAAFHNDGLLVVNDTTPVITRLIFGSGPALEGTGTIRLAAHPDFSWGTDMAGSGRVLGPELSVRGTGRVWGMENHGRIIADVPEQVLILEGVIQSPEAQVAADAGILEVWGTILGGSVRTENGGLIRIRTADFRDTLLAGDFRLQAAVATFHNSNIFNAGQSLIAPAANGLGNATMRFQTSATIDGPGVLTLDRGGFQTWMTIDCRAPVTNAESHTIDGCGIIYGPMINNGRIIGNQPPQQLTVIDLTQGPTGQVIGDGGRVRLRNVAGGRLEGVNGGAVRLESTFSDLTISGRVEIDSATAQLTGLGMTNDGELHLVIESGSANAVLEVMSDAELLGAGRIVLAPRALHQVQIPRVRTGPGFTLTQTVDHSITGPGIVNGTIINHGQFRGDHPTQSLRLENVQLTQSASGRILGDGGSVDIISSSITGGTLGSDNGGHTQFTVGTSTLAEARIDGDVRIIDSAEVHYTSPVLTNDGSLSVGSLFGTAVLHFPSDATLQGVGLLRAVPSGLNRRLRTADGAVLTNAAGHTIGGRGYVAARIHNEGIIAPDSFLLCDLPVSLAPTSTVMITYGSSPSGTIGRLYLQHPTLLDGRMLVSLTPEQAPALGSPITIVSAPALTGRFAEATFPTMEHPGRAWCLEYLPAAVRLRVTCRADVNCDGAVNAADVGAFIELWLASLQQESLDADFDGDGRVNSSDISAFIAAWLSAAVNGC